MKSPSFMICRRATGLSSMAKCRRSLTPRFINGSRIIFSRIVSAESLGSTKADCASWPRCPLLKTSRSDWQSCRGCWYTVIFSRKTSLLGADTPILSTSKECVRACLSMIWRRCYLIPTSGSRRPSERNYALIMRSAAACHRLPKCGKYFGFAQCNG